jgi:hypothetical protein
MKLEVNTIVMASVVYHIGSSRATPSPYPYQWQVGWGFKQFSGEAATEEAAQKAAEEMLQRLYEKFHQVWKSAYSTKAARKQK